VIRVATVDDVSELARLESASAARPWEAPAIAAHLRGGAGRALLALREGEGVGHVLFTLTADEGEILSIGVVPHHRREGIARELLAALEQLWSEQGVHQAFLEVRRDNTAARAAYAADGWVQVGCRPGYYHDGCDGLVLRREVPR
jgi:ribosomal-protein-alanine N-acetyltransferase